MFTTFFDLEKAHDRVPRYLVYWSLRKRKVPEKLVRLVKATYKKATTVVRTAHGKTGQFEIEVGLHQGSGRSPFLFTIVLDTISEECRNGLPWELLFADDPAAYMKTPLDFCGFQLIGCVTYVTAAVTARRRHTVRLIAHAGSAQSTSSQSLSGRNRTLLDETALAAVTLAQGILD